MPKIGPGRKSIWTLHRPIYKGSKYSRKRLRELRRERGVGKPPDKIRQGKRGTL